MMIETTLLLPPDAGPRSNPVLYGVAEAIAERFPPIVLSSPACEEALRQQSPLDADEEQAEPRSILE